MLHAKPRCTLRFSGATQRARRLIGLIYRISEIRWIIIRFIVLERCEEWPNIPIPVFLPFQIKKPRYKTKTKNSENNAARKEAQYTLMAIVARSRPIENGLT